MPRSEPQSHLRFPLTRALGNGGNVRVLRALATFHGPRSASQLASETGLTPQGVRLVLDGLESQRLVSVLGSARSQLYELDEGNPFAKSLRKLFDLERLRWERLQEGLREVLNAEAHVRSAWLYGSVARGMDASGSDVDVAILVDSSDVEAADRVRNKLVALEQRERVVFSVTAVTPEDVMKLPLKDKWWVELSRDAKVLKGLAPEQEMVRAKKKDRVK